MDRETLERRYAEARDALLIEFGTRWTERKPFLFLVHRALIVVIMVAAGYTGPRFFGLLALFALKSAVELYERQRIRTVACSEHQIANGTVFGMFLLAVGCAFTGGYASPLIPALLAPAVIPAAAFGRRPITWFLLGELVVLLAILLMLPPWVTGPIMPPPWVSIGIGVSIVFAVWVSVVNLVSITEVYARAAVTAARMREEVLEQHEARARGLESIGAKVAHELKNPLAAIGGLAQLLLQGSHDDKTRERLSVIASEVGRMEKTMREYLAFSRPLDEVRPSDVDLGTLTDDVLALLEGRARARSVTLERTGESLHATVDAARMKEALINLVDNAIAASPAGGRVSVEVSRAACVTHVRVRDRGEGIAPEILARVGTPYFTTRADGTGLGVVIARAAIEQHGGTLVLESRRGEGTTADIALPHASSARAA